MLMEDTSMKEGKLVEGFAKPILKLSQNKAKLFCDTIRNKSEPNLAMSMGCPVIFHMYDFG